MARKVKDKEVDSREARSKLKPRGKPYKRAVERGLLLGYRRLKGKSGTWWAIHYLGNRQYEYQSLGVADDLSDADGTAILDYWQAQTKAREGMVQRARAAAGETGPLTVEAAVERYLQYLESERRTAADARYRASALIFPTLGGIEAAALTADQITAWRDVMARQAPRVRTAKGSKQAYGVLDSKNAEAIRRRRSSVNRTLTILKAALNFCWRKGLIPSDAQWRRVEPFRGVDVARARYLSVAECKRLVNAASDDFKLLVQAALATGARYGELAALRAADFNPDSGTVAVHQSKSDKPRHVHLTEEGAVFFRRLAAGRPGSNLLLRRADGAPWAKSNQSQAMIDACDRADIKPRISFHGLRHTVASLAAMNGVPLMVIAQNLGHADTKMVERHYGHLAPSFVADEIRKGAPRFGFKPDRKVTTIGTRT